MVKQSAAMTTDRRFTVLLGSGLALLMVLVAFAYLALRPDAAPPGGSGERSPLAARSWPLPTNVPAAVQAAGLSLGPMGTAEHYHPRLTILVNGQPVVVPAGIGVDPRSGAMSALHTHTSDGELHVEAATRGERFTLGQLFEQWAVPLSQTRLGDLDVQQVVATVNGEPFDGDPASIVLAPEQEIVLEAR